MTIVQNVHLRTLKSGPSDESPAQSRIYYKTGAADGSRDNADGVSTRDPSSEEIGAESLNGPER